MTEGQQSHLLDLMMALRDRREAYVLATVVETTGSASASPGSKALIGRAQSPWAPGHPVTARDGIRTCGFLLIAKSRKETLFGSMLAALCRVIGLISCACFVSVERCLNGRPHTASSTMRCIPA